MSPSRRETAAAVGLGTGMVLVLVWMLALLLACAVIAVAIVVLSLWGVAHVFTLGRFPAAPWAAAAALLLSSIEDR